jgi:hypothetical protein
MRWNLFTLMKRLTPSLFAAQLLILSATGGNSNNAAVAKPTTQPFHMPDTPYLPPYMGRIVAGDYSSALQPDGGIAYSITFEAAEQPAQVLNWYRTAFQMYSWKLDANSPAQFRLAAQHGKNLTTNIFLMSPRKAGANTQVQLFYRCVGKDI